MDSWLTLDVSEADTATEEKGKRAATIEDENTSQETTSARLAENEPKFYYPSNHWHDPIKLPDAKQPTARSQPRHYNNV